MHGRIRPARLRSAAHAVVAVALLTGHLLCGWFASPALAQEGQAPAPSASAGQVAVALAPEGTTQELTLKDGSTLYGRVAEFDDTRVVFIAVSGARIEVARGDVLSLRIAKGRVVEGRFLRADPNPTRLFFAPTARALPKGEAYVGVYEFFLPFVQVGVTNRLSIGGGTPLVFGGGGDRVFWFTPKLTAYDDGRTSAAVGLFQFGGAGIDEPPGIAYGVVTVGQPDAAFSAGLGYAYAGDSRTGVVMLGGEKRLSRHIKLLTENWVWKGGYSFFSGGFRFMGESLSADLGLVLFVDSGDSFAFPMVNFAYHF